ncbi:hypothetical protein SRHO_G00194210 [Serrasalmus rhombeus]
MNNRANKIHQLRQELKSLRRRFKEEERGPLAELRNILCKKLMTLRRAEWHRRRRKERARKLWKILKVIWRRGKAAQQSRFAEGVWIPKEEESKTIDQFRTISLLSVEGKIFFSIVARHLTDYILRNSYIDTSVQKGGIPKVLGCLEHTGVVTQLIREARENKGDLVVLWLSLTNAYVSTNWLRRSCAGTTSHK